MISLTIIILGVITAVLWYIWNGRDDWKNCPPGPRRLPFLGSLLSLDRVQYKSYWKWAKEYGPIVRMDLANTKTVVISDHKMVKEIFADSAFAGRIEFFQLFDFCDDGKLHGVGNTEGEEWEELRRFTLRQLRDFGFGKSSMEDSIMAEVTEFINLISEKDGKPIENVKDRLVLAVINSLWFVVTGKRYRQTDKKLLDMNTQANDVVNGVLTSWLGGLLIFAPKLANLAPNLTGYTKVRREVEAFAKLFKEPIEEHKESFQEDFDRDFIDVFLREIKKTTDPNSAFYKKLGEDHLLGVLGDLYFAGTDTTSSTLSFLILYLSKMPHIQKKFQKEIQEVVGSSRAVSVKDRPEMPYTEALLAEVMRYSSIAPNGVQHKAVQDKEFHGYLIPKGTVITANLYFIHHDPRVWGDPVNFRPERFLSEDEKTFRKHEALIPFSTGRRQCLGESLARDSLFLFATNIFQRFWVEYDNTGPDHGFEPAETLFLTPQPYRVIFKNRMT